MKRFFGSTLFLAAVLVPQLLGAAPAAFSPLVELTGEGKFANVTGIAHGADGRIFAACGREEPINVFSADGKLIGAFGKGVLKDKHGLRRFGESLWATDAGGDSVVEFSPDGRIIRRIAGDFAGLPLNRPCDVAVAPTGEIFIADGYGNQRIVKLDHEGKYLASWGKRGSKAGEFSIPHNLIITRDGRLAVADRGNRRLQFFDLEGTFLTAVVTPGEPFALAEDADGNLLVTCVGTGWQGVAKFSAAGELLGRYGRAGRGKGETLTPHALSRNPRTGEWALGGAGDQKIMILPGDSFDHDDPLARLRCYYPFEEGLREAESSLPLAVLGIPRLVAGVAGQALAVNQGDGMAFPAPVAGAPEASAIIPGQAFGISFWFRLAPGTHNRFQILAGSAAASPAGRRNYVIAYVPENGGRIEFLMRPAGGGKQVTAVSVPYGGLSIDGWNHVVAVCDGRRIGVSAVPITMASHTPVMEMVDLKGESPAEAMPLVLGGRELDERGAALLEGALDEFVIVNGEMTPEMIAALFAAGKAGKPATTAFTAPGAPVPEPVLLYERSPGQPTPERLDKELGHGDFELEFLLDGKLLQTSPLKIWVGADGFGFDPDGGRIFNTGNAGSADFRNHPLRVSGCDFESSGRPSFHLVSRHGELVIRFAGAEIYRAPFSRDTIGSIRFEDPAGAVALVRGRGDFRRFPERVAVFRSGENAVAFFRIPAIALSADGSTLLVFAEARHDGINDIGSNDIVLKRSIDGGRNWLPMQTLYGSGQGQGISCNNPSPVVDRRTGRIHLLFSVCRKWGDEKSGFSLIQLTSDDNGATWSEPRDIAPETTAPEWSSNTPGPGHGIQLENGVSAGRLLIPAWHNLPGGGWKVGSHVLYSDDGGENWHSSTALAPLSDECQLAELPDGEIFFYLRSAPIPANAERNLFRKSWSRDGGVTWSDTVLESSVIAVPCQRSVIAADGVLYSLFPGSGNWSVNVPRRAGLSLVSSRDGGRTWHDRRLIDPNRGAYSDLVALGSGRLGAAVEHGCLNSYDTISFIEIAVDPEDDAADAVPGTDEKQRK